MNLILPFALEYASRGWPVFRLSKAKVPLKGSHGHLDATTDPDLIRQWWDVANPPNIGLACGDIIVIDFDSADAIASPWGQLLQAGMREHGMPQTLMASTRRGLHFYYRAPPGVTLRTKNEPRKAAGDPGIDIKAHGGYVVMPPSVSKGFAYAWVTPVQEVAELPAWMVAWAESCGSAPRAAAPKMLPAGLPAHLQGRTGARLAERREAASEDDLDRLWSALQAIPAEGYDTWYQIGMALHTTGWGDPAFDLFDQWSETSEKYDADAVEAKWSSFEHTARGEVTLGTVFHLAKQNGWVEPRVETIPLEMRAFSADQSSNDRATLNGHHLNGHAGPVPQLFVQKTPDSPLIELNDKFAVIGDLGGKCLIMSWAELKSSEDYDETIKVPTFQSARDFALRFGHRYINVRVEKKEGEFVEEAKQLGAYWLKWNARKTFEGIDLVPEGPPLLPGNVLNLWSGFAVAPAPGSWPRLRQHVTDVLADGTPESAQYILRWAAWCVQNPGRRAEVALVLKGAKGIGKGAFAHAMRRIFGHHGLHISNSKHFVGQFNSHLQNCLLLFADEAFWAGDKQGESVLKALVTEPTMSIEKKGVDLMSARNRLKVIMAANADWVVPASADERRYAVFNVSNRFSKDKAYKRELFAEINGPGLAAMLHDLLAMDLGGWHPREVIFTKGLLEQKMESMSPLQQWFSSILEDGALPGGAPDQTVPAAALLHHGRDGWDKLRYISPKMMGHFLSSHGCVKVHTRNGNAWLFPDLPKARAQWAEAYGGQWIWPEELPAWRSRSGN